MATSETSRLRALMARVAELEAIIAGRAERPTHAEIAAHPGEWRWIVATPSGLAGGRATSAAWITEHASSLARWWPLDAEGRPCAWPTAEVSRG